MKTSTAEHASLLTFDYRLGDLPSSQHRAGLAGLVLISRWLDRLEHQGRFEVELRPDGASLRFDRDGLEALFGEIYGADRVERHVETKWADAKPLRTYEQETQDAATGKTKRKTLYVYEAVQPRGAFLADVEGGDGPWVKLWRAFIWQVMRGKPKSRLPFDIRTEGKAPADVDKLWKELLKAASGKDATTSLAGSLFLGAADRTPDNVSYLDRVAWQFLLHGWVFAATIYQVASLDNDGKRVYEGFAVAIPDVADLELFCDDYQEMLPGRPSDTAGPYPQAANVYVPGEAGLDSFWRLREGLKGRLAEPRLEQVVWGMDVIHAAKAGNNIVIRQAFRIEPNAEAESLCQQIRGTLWHPLARRLRTENLLSRRPWYAGFDRLFATRSLSATLEDRHFRHDCRELFAMEIRDADLAQDERSFMPDTIETTVPASVPYSAERCVLRLVRAYVSRRVESKHGTTWKEAQADEARKGAYADARHKVAKDAFLAVRSRTGADFIEYFAATMCSVPQWLPEDEFVQLTQDLYQDPDKIRTLTLIALSAQG